MEIVCDKDQTQYCNKRMTLFGFQFDQLNLWASYYLPKGESSFTLISFIILQHKCDKYYLMCIILGFGILKE